MLPIIVGILAVIILFTGVYYGLSVPPKKAPTESGPMMANVAGDYHIDEEIEATIKKLHPGVQSEIATLEENVKKASDNTAKSIALEALGKKWIDLKNNNLGAYYMSESGFLDNSEKKLNFASHLLSEGLESEQDPAKRQWMAQTAVKSLEKVLEAHPDDVNTKIDIASLYITGLGQPMQGVQQLLSIVEKDSTNLPANLVLGKMAIESNQLDKAISRGEIILRHYPDNWEARIFMAEAYNRLGQKEEAITMLETAKKYNKNQDFIKDVNQYIDLIKQ